MTLNILFAARPERWQQYRAPLESALAAEGLDVNLGTDLPPETVDYIVYAPNGPLRDFTPYTRARAVLSLWAGVETIVGNPTLKIPLTRMVDHGLTQGMTEWVVGHSLRHHLGIDSHIHGQNGTWNPISPPLAEDRRITILGLGTLGQACAAALTRIGFPVTGWSRTPKIVEGITCRAGPEGLRAALATADICILLLPDTPATENILNTETIGWMPRGAFVMNPGRGPLIDDTALLSALDTGQIAHATLDVFRIEPLPADHPYWAHPNVTVTPHIAAETRADTAAQVVAENIRRSEAGQPLRYLVDPERGY
ncbi:MAG: glyoxylate/hydroxypyruvate reductase A [Rhodobacteraceae bacterium]|nr:glyoxylate/hydroxypyruvate reductase A [Paracoccaceae bacterium]